MASELAIQISQSITAYEAKKLAQTKSIQPIDAQIEAWKTMPKEQALKEAIALMRNKGLDPAEKRIELEVLKYVSELQGAFVQQRSMGTNIVAIKFVLPEPIVSKPIIDVS